MIVNARTGFDAIPGDIASTKRPDSLEAAAEQFEAMFLRTILKEMRKSVDAMSGDEGMFSSREARNLRDFYDDSLAQELASQRSTGIADLLVKQLSTGKTGQEKT
ncbi:flagellar rod assembly protein/muramidase FlgJ [Enterobacterales bacterium CwR94]|nr:flagellar rod assembly protein/muramidase FlgJ [Enterobacterales bacterium CwR94]